MRGSKGTDDEEDLDNVESWEAPADRPETNTLLPQIYLKTSVGFRVRSREVFRGKSFISPQDQGLGQQERRPHIEAFFRVFFV